MRLIRLKSNSASPHCSGIKAVLLEETWLVRKMKGYTDVHLEEKCRRAERKDIVNSFGPDIWALVRSWPHYNLSGTSCPASRLSEQLLVCTLYNLPQNPLFSPFPNLSPDSRWNCLVHPSYEFMITMYFYSYYFLIYPQKKKELCTFIKFSHKPLLLSPFNLFHRHSVAQLHFLFLASIDSSSVKVKPTSSFLSRYLIGPRTIFFWLVKTQVSIILIPYSTLHLILINLNFLAAMNPGSTSTW